MYFFQRGDAKAVKAIATNLAEEPVHSGDLPEFDEVCLGKYSLETLQSQLAN